VQPTLILLAVVKKKEKGTVEGNQTPIKICHLNVLLFRSFRGHVDMPQKCPLNP